MIEALGIAMVKNEADVIEAFVRHNLSLMDLLVIIDNDSVDDTRGILVQLQREGLPIVVFDDPVVGHFQAEIVTAVYRKVVPIFGPRFVFLLDADEFIVAPSRETLYTQLRALRPGTQAQYSWRTYIPAPTGPEGNVSDPLRSITHRRAVEQPWYKPIIVTKPKLDMKLSVKQGNHGVSYAGLPLRKVKLRDVTIAHFPVRSVEQFTSKILVGWIANLERNRYRLDVAHGIHWKVVYDRIIRGPAFTTQDLTLEALKYAQLSKSDFEWPRDVVRDPVLPAYACLTTRPATTTTSLQKVVRSIDRIFNPEAHLSGLASDVQFLHDSDRKKRPQRHRRWLFTNRINRRDAEPYIDLPPFRYLAERHCPRSVLQVGSTSGVYLKYFAFHGASRIKGVDCVETRPKYLEVDEYVEADLGKPLDLKQTFDLVICAGLNHKAAKFDCTVVENITRHARDRIVLSRTADTQLESDETLPDMLDLFASAGWYPLYFESLALRSLSTLPWLRAGLVVLARDSTDATAARKRLMELEPPSINQKKQWPAVIAHPLTETEATLSAHRDSRVVAMANKLMRAVIARAFR
ncbi:glycosyltransferase family 2 protein [Mycobacterium sp. 852002-30065_SCH5024008]|uniref:glycosyltransferase family 2 protein n=1 Tax=Mycobacterium sp. 852002-30065_SCH5024008 TaxID=1834088 RepID=UPI0009ECC558|nr:glycosyltransferase family 2 protein [Mycobacterium sp. 852002-30065_SCH5024008]